MRLRHLARAAAASMTVSPEVSGIGLQDTVDTCAIL
jgi:hypothetical protein